MALVYCVDFGSTYTKVALVDDQSGELVGRASHPTTVGTDVLDGFDAARRELVPLTGGTEPAVLGCSSAGGGLRVAVVGNEELVTAEAGRRVALSSGGRVVQVSSGRIDVASLRASRPDVILLLGGTDGGDSEVLLHNTAVIARARWRRPVVVAGNREVARDVADQLGRANVPFEVTDNVVPQIGTLRPAGARRAIREMFLAHVIGGKHLSQRADFTAMVRGATPDVVLSAVELLAGGVDDDHPGVGDVVVVDVGGATTDVHSVVAVEPDESGLSREVVATVPVTRTVEADLGVWWSAASTVAAGEAAGLLPPGDLQDAAAQRAEHPGRVPASAAESAADRRIAQVAVVLAARRHAGRQQVVLGPEGRLVERTGTDLREVGLLVGSGGVLRHCTAKQARGLLVAATGDQVAGGWLLPRAPRVTVDVDYVLAAAGLLAETRPRAAYALLGRLRGRATGRAG